MIAYLVVAHNHPELLERLVKRLSHMDSRVIVHVDKRADIAPFETLLAPYPHVSFLPESQRVTVFWKGWSVVEATHRLTKAGLAAGADRLVLLSGADYPLVPANELDGFFRNNDREYIHYFSLITDLPKWQSHIDHYWYWDSKLTNTRCGYASTADRFHRHIQHKLLNKLPKRRFLADMEPFGGSNWWMLTADCARYCCEYIDGHPEFKRFYRFSESPDEMVYQTIIMNSPFAHKAPFYAEYAANRASIVENVVKKRLGFTPFNLRYVDWYSPERGFPADLTEDNFVEMAESGALFARKMHPELSSQLLEMIDKKLLVGGFAQRSTIAEPAAKRYADRAR